MAEASARSRAGVAVQVAVLGALTLGSLAWAGWGMDLRATLAAAAGFDLRWALPMTVCLFGTLFLRVLRFRLLLDHPVDNRGMLGVTAIGFLAINVVPLRMGEFVRPFLLAERHGSPFGLALAALFMERLLDLSALMVLLAMSIASFSSVNVVIESTGPKISSVRILLPLVTPVTTVGS